MPKIKTHTGAKKRFKFTKNGKIKFKHAFMSHLTAQMTTKRKRKLRKEAYADDTNAAAVRQMLPYK